MTETCLQIPLDQLFENGFSTGHGYLREPNSILRYSALACIAIQSNQNDMHGGQSVPAFDYYMAPGVAKTMITELVKVIDTRYDDIDIDALKSELKGVQKEHKLILNDAVKEKIKDICVKYISKLSSNAFNKLWEKALKYADKATHQAMEALIHNLNSMHSRAGSQVTGAVSL